MKTSRLHPGLLTAATACAVLALLAPSARAAVENKNLIRNGDFEDPGTPPPGWTLTPTAGESCSLTPESLTGKQALKMSAPVAGTVTVTSDSCPVTPGDDYLFIYWYRADGMSTKGANYEGCSAGAFVVWQDATGKQLGQEMTDLPYGAVPDYQASTYTITAPAGATQVALRYYVSVGAEYKGPPSAIFLDGVRLMHLTAAATPSAQAEKWDYTARNEAAGIKTIADPDAAGGTAVLGPVGATYPLAGGVYLADPPAGEYLVTYRVKVSDNTKHVAVATLSVNIIGCLNYRVASKTLFASDFKQPGAYQEFTYRFVRPEDGTISFYVTPMGANAAADLIFDKITVVQLAAYDTDKKLAAIWLGE